MDGFQIGFLIALGAAIVKGFYNLLMQVIWSPYYFEKGILIWSKMYPANPASKWPLSAQELQDRFTRRIGRSFMFRELRQGRYAFRPTLIEIGLYKSIDAWAAGVLDWNYEDRYVEVRVYMDWVSVALYAVMAIGIVVMIVAEPRGSLIAFLFFSMAILFSFLMLNVAALALAGKGYLKLGTIYDEIGRFAASRWSHIIDAYGVDA